MNVMNVHAFMNELDQKDYWYPRKKKKLWKSMYKVNGELSSCDITYSGRAPSREGDIHNFALSLLLNGLSKSAQTFTIRFLKLLFPHPIHIVVWGNFHSIVLVNSNKFPSVFQKVQHSHSRHQKTTSNLLRINFNGKLRLNKIWPIEGAMYITLW